MPNYDPWAGQEAPPEDPLASQLMGLIAGQNVQRMAPTSGGMGQAIQAQQPQQMQVPQHLKGKHAPMQAGMMPSGDILGNLERWFRQLQIGPQLPQVDPMIERQRQDIQSNNTLASADQHLGNAMRSNQGHREWLDEYDRQQRTKQMLEQLQGQR